MGRRKKYVTSDEIKSANSKKAKKFYWENKDQIDLKSRAIYWNKKLHNVLLTNPIGAGDIIKAAMEHGIPIELLNTIDKN